MFIAAHPGDYPGGEIDRLLDAVQMGLGGSSPDGDTVKDVGEDVGLDKEFEDVGCEMVTDFVEGKEDGVAPPDHCGYVRIPGQMLIKGDSQNFYGLTGRSTDVGDVESKIFCLFEGLSGPEESEKGLCSIHL